MRNHDNGLCVTNVGLCTLTTTDNACSLLLRDHVKHLTLPVCIQNNGGEKLTCSFQLLHFTSLIHGDDRKNNT